MCTMWQVEPVSAHESVMQVEPVSAHESVMHVEPVSAHESVNMWVFPGIVMSDSGIARL